MGNRFPKEVRLEPPSSGKSVEAKADFLCYGPWNPGPAGGQLLHPPPLFFGLGDTSHVHRKWLVRFLYFCVQTKLSIFKFSNFKFHVSSFYFNVSSSTFMCQVHVSFGFDKQTKTESTYGIGPTVPTELWATQKQQAVRKLSQAQDKLS